MSETESKWTKQYAKLYQQARRQKLLQAGLCVRCGKAQPIPGKTRCVKCAKKQNDANTYWRQRNGLGSKIKRGTMPVQLDHGAYMPTRAHDADAGFDLYSRDCNAIIMAGGSYLFDTGVHMQIPRGFAGLIKSRSGLNCRSGLQSEGVIDCGYTGGIAVKLYNNSDCDAVINQGERIAQILIVPVYTPTLYEVDRIDGGDRGDNGFGSSGR